MNQTTHFDQLPGSAFLRLADFASTKGKPGIVPVSGSTVWRWVKEGSFPAPVKLAPKTTAWRMADVREWLADHEAQHGTKPLGIIRVRFVAPQHQDESEKVAE